MPKIEKVLQKLDSFKNLKAGWHYGDGVPVSQKFVDHASNFLQNASLEGIERFNAFPGVEGEVHITIHYRDFTLALTWEIDEKITVVEDKAGEVISDHDGFTPAQALDRLWEFIQKTQILSESYIYDTGMRKQTVLKVPPLVFRPTKAYLSSRASAPSMTRQQYAHILSRSTQTSPVTLPSFGVSASQNFQDVNLNNRLVNPATDVTTTCLA